MECMTALTVLYSVDENTGMLTEVFCLPVSGEYPKDASLFPNNRFLVSLNHETNDMTFFLGADSSSLLIISARSTLPVIRSNR